MKVFKNIVLCVRKPHAHKNGHSEFSIVPCAGAGSLEQCRELNFWKLPVSGQQLRQVTNRLCLLNVKLTLMPPTRSFSITFQLLVFGK